MFDFNVSFYTKTSPSMGTRRLFFDNLAEDFNDIGIRASVSGQKYDAKSDVIIIKSNDYVIDKIRRANPQAIIGVVHPSDLSLAMLCQTKTADFIISGSVEEYDYYLKYNQNIYILPHIEKDWGVKKQHLPKEPIVIGYHGNKEHLESLGQNIGSVLEKLNEKYRIKLKVIYDIKGVGRWEKKCPDIEIEHVQWEYSTFARELQSCDIGLVPSVVSSHNSKKVFRLIKSLYHNGHPNDYLLRFKNCSNAGRIFVFAQIGIPVVANMTPENCQFLFHDRRGYLAQSKESWYSAIEKLICDAGLRQQIADAANIYFLENYNRDVYVKNLADKINTLVRLKKSDDSTHFSKTKLNQKILPQEKICLIMARWNTTMIDILRKLKKIALSFQIDQK